MATGFDEEAFGADEADRLLKAGWGQGSVARPNEHVPLPPGLEAWPRDVWLVVCTQACGVVSPDIGRDPLVEFALAFPVARYSPRSPEATGKNVRRFHLPVSGADFPALAVEINTRFFLPRRRLLSFGPEAVKADTPAARELAGWLGRHYTRIALPNELVRRLGSTLFAVLGKHLAETSGPTPADGPAPRFHESVSAIFVRWSPDTELGPNEVYAVGVLALCDEATVADELDRRLSMVERQGNDGVTYTLTVQGRAETVLTDLDGWVRLTEWDYLTGMARTAALPG